MSNNLRRLIAIENALAMQVPWELKHIFLAVAAKMFKP